MKKIFSILFALVLVVLLTFGSCVVEENGGEPTVQEWLPDVHGEVTFSQLEWLEEPGVARYPYSNVGEVEFAFLAGAGDWLLDQHGGGWLHVVIDTTAAGGDLQWAVQNLYLTYKNMDYLLGSTPSVQFSLGLDNETPIEELEAAVFLSSEPLEEQPEAEELSAYTVSLEPYLVGGGMFGDLDGGSATSDIPLIIGPFIGLAALPVRTESISIPVKNVTKINEGHNMCARGAVARSISYLGKVHNFTTDNPQDIYDDLVKAMNITGNNRTIEAKLLDGKNSYCVKKGLNITSEILPPTGVPNSTAMWKDITKKVQDALKNKCDVEIWIAWNATSGHMAMVTSVTTSANGSATITYVDDPIQGDGNATNKAHVISTNASGNFDTTSSVVGFMIECYVPQEEEEEEEEWSPPLKPWVAYVHGEVSFMQLEWMASPGEALYPYSNVGAVEFAFLEEAGDWLLDQHGGGWLNVMIDTTAAGGGFHWAVQNLYLTYYDVDDLLGSTPSVQFSLGLDGETPIEGLMAAVFLSSEPLEEQPEVEELSAYTVSLEPYLVGGRLEGGSALSDIPLIIGSWIGPIFLADRTATVAGVAVAAIDEGHQGCAPGSAARSIDYLGELNGFDTDNPQDIYDDLVDAMDTDICGSGTTDCNMLDGKNSYSEANDLPIYTYRVYTDTYDPEGGSSWGDLIQKVQGALDAGCDVEILIGWSGGGGHAAMVTSVTRHADGSATIHYVDDPTQGDGQAENQDHVITTDASGNFGTGTVDGFMIECYE